MYTPWGKAEIVNQIAIGIQFISTASHGGHKLDRIRNRMIPEPFRRVGGWYEEDCEYHIVSFFLLPNEPAKKEESKQILKNHWPHEWMKYSGEILKLEDSKILQEEQFSRDNANNYVAIATWGGNIVANNFPFDWREIWSIKKAEEQFPGFKFSGPGWYFTKTDSMLVVETEDPDKFWFYVWGHREALHAFKAVANAPIRQTEKI